MSEMPATTCDNVLPFPQPDRPPEVLSGAAIGAKIVVAVRLLQEIHADLERLGALLRAEDEAKRRALQIAASKA